MSQIEFIEKNIEDLLVKEGHTKYVAINCAREASRTWRRSTGSKGPMFNALIVAAKKQAKSMKKAGL